MPSPGGGFPYTAAVLRVLLVVVHLGIAAVWTGSMAYSLTVVQPKVAVFFADEQRREEFLVALAHGNRRRVVALVAALLLTGLGVLAGSSGWAAAGIAVSLGLYAVAAGVFANVSWRHWPARVFALPEELPGFQRRLRLQAASMTVLVGAGFLLALAVSVA